MKKTFFIISSLATVASLPLLWVLIQTILVISPQTGRSMDAILILIVALIPVLSLIGGYLLNKKNKLSELYSLIFIIMNVMLGIILAFYGSWILSGGGV
ncbi:hypothetical protein HQ571_01550 [Candidatus Kuenenbacteria bacterium]|nr:hypothetical protein [Candidatus Kuenenbacteria bacterium]